MREIHHRPSGAESEGKGGVEVRKRVLWGTVVQVPVVGRDLEPTTATEADLWRKLRGFVENYREEPARVRVLGALDDAMRAEFQDIGQLLELLERVRGLRARGAAQKLLGAVGAELQRRINLLALKSSPSSSTAVATKKWPTDLGRAGSPALRRHRRAPIDATPRRRLDPIIAEARVLLPEGALVVVGGVPRACQRSRLDEAFRRPVRWPELRVHGPIDPAAAAIERSDTGVLIILKGLCGHLQIADAVRIAHAANKPVVRVARGVGPAAVAQAIIRQIGRPIRSAA